MIGAIAGLGGVNKLVGNPAGKIGEKILGGIGGVFGAGKSPNYGTANLEDALNNFEGISDSKARTLRKQIVQEIRLGASNSRLGRMITTAGGYSNVNDVMGSEKGRILQRQINKIRSNTKNNSGGNFGNNSGGQGQSNQGSGLNLSVVAGGLGVAYGVKKLFFD